MHYSLAAICRQNCTSRGLPSQASTCSRMPFARICGAVDAAADAAAQAIHSHSLPKTPPPSGMRNRSTGDRLSAAARIAAAYCAVSRALATCSARGPALPGARLALGGGAARRGREAGGNDPASRGGARLALAARRGGAEGRRGGAAQRGREAAAGHAGRRRGGARLPLAERGAVQRGREAGAGRAGWRRGGARLALAARGGGSYPETLDLALAVVAVAIVAVAIVAVAVVVVVFPAPKK